MTEAQEGQGRQGEGGAQPSDWPEGDQDGIQVEGLVRSPPQALFVFIWFYCIVWWLIQDAAKVYAYKFIKHFNLMNIHDTGIVRRNESTIKYRESHYEGSA